MGGTSSVSRDACLCYSNSVVRPWTFTGRGGFKFQVRWKFCKQRNRLHGCRWPPCRLKKKIHYPGTLRKNVRRPSNHNNYHPKKRWKRMLLCLVLAVHVCSDGSRDWHLCDRPILFIDVRWDQLSKFCCRPCRSVYGCRYCVQYNFYL